MKPGCMAGPPSSMHVRGQVALLPPGFAGWVARRRQRHKIGCPEAFLRTRRILYDFASKPKVQRFTCPLHPNPCPTCPGIKISSLAGPPGRSFAFRGPLLVAFNRSTVPHDQQSSVSPCGGSISGRSPLIFLRFLKPDTAIDPTSGITALNRLSSVRKLLIQQAGQHLKPAEAQLSSGNSDSPRRTPIANPALLA